MDSISNVAVDRWHGMASVGGDVVRQATAPRGIACRCSASASVTSSGSEAASAACRGSAAAMAAHLGRRAATSSFVIPIDG